MPRTSSATAVAALLLLGGTVRAGEPAPSEGLRRLVLTAGASGYESAVRAAIRASLPGWAHPIEDNLGNFSVTIGSGKPHRLLLAHMDEPGYVVTGIRPDGYLSVQRLARVPLPPLFDQFHVGQPLVVGARTGAVRGVAVVPSTHLWRASDAPMGRAAADEDLLIDVGARSPREVADAGVALLDSVVIGRRVVDLAGGWLAGPALDNRAGCAALLNLLAGLEPVKVTGTLTIAFTTQGLADGRGAQRLAARLAPDEAVVVDWPAAHESRTSTAKDALLSSGPSVVAPSAGNRLSADLFARLTQIAGGMSIPLQPLVHSGTAEAAAFAAPVKVGIIGAPILYSGTPGQVVDPRDLAALSRLLTAYVEQEP